MSDIASSTPPVPAATGTWGSELSDASSVSEETCSFSIDTMWTASGKSSTAIFLRPAS